MKLLRRNLGSLPPAALKKHLQGYFTAMPWKELMLGQGLLSIGIGLIGLLLVNVVPDATYKFLAGLTQDRFRGIYIVLMKIVIVYGLLLFAIPVLLISSKKLRGDGKLDEDSGSPSAA